MSTSTFAAVELPSDVEHALLQIAGNALSNTATHRYANRAILRLDCHPGR